MCDETIFPGKEGTAVTSVLSGTTNLAMSFPIGHDSIFFGTFVAFPLLFSMFPAEMLLDSSQVPEGSSRVVVYACLLGTDVHFLFHLLLVCPLL